MGKANISFPDGMLEDVDARATEAGTTRSAFIQEATAQYLAQLDYRTERAKRATRIEHALVDMREIGASLPPGPDGVTILRQMRDAVPEWLTQRAEPGDE